MPDAPITPHDLAGQRVLRTEAEALMALSAQLPADFAATVDAILGLKGRVVLSGIGKSGHVARKIASTLASTGTPSMFVHPAEASHGDLGMVTPQDLCILLSNSGETPELRDLIAHCVRFDIPLVGMSKAPGSSLMSAADFRLTVPDLPEACAIGMAPTTSTTLMMALGDALAVALMEARKFEVEAFRNYHPGGKLGAQLTPVHQIMHPFQETPLVAETAAMQDAIRVISDFGFGLTGVVDDGGLLVGIISDGDLRRNIVGLLDRTAGGVATRKPVTVGPQTLAAEAIATINKSKIGALFVCEAGRPVGILHLHDLLRIGVM